MTKEEALNQLLKLENKIKDLQNERNNLRKIVLGQSLFMTRSDSNNFNGVKKHNKTGVSKEAVCKALKDYGPLKFSDIVNETHLSSSACSFAITNLLKMNIINRDNGDGHGKNYTYELAVKQS